MNKIRQIKNQIRSRPNQQNLGFPTPKPHKVALKVFNYANKFQPNNSGMHMFDLERRRNNPFKNFEINSLRFLGKVLGEENIEGYVTTGGTEGNICALWIARNLLLEKSTGKNDIALLKTSLTHYSIRKACNILDIQKVIDIKLNDNYSMNLENLRANINRLITSGIKAIILIGVMGNTVVGTVDDFEKINAIIEEYKILNPEVVFYFHIDAAFGGFILPFLSDRGKVLNLKNVRSVVLDGHKMGQTPYPCGVIVTRKDLFQYITAPVSYTGHADNTVVGSRSGAAAASLWAMLESLGVKGYTRSAVKALELKKYLIDKLELLSKEIHLITDNDLNLFGISFGENKNMVLDKCLEQKYCLHSTIIELDDNNKELVYQIVVMPHLNKKTLNKFYLDIKAFLNEQ